MTEEQQERALNILHNMALEKTGWRSLFAFTRWFINDEPLRNDAANLIRDIGYICARPEGTRLTGKNYILDDAGNRGWIIK